MVRNYKRTTDHAKHSPEQVRSAVQAVLSEDLSLCAAADVYEIPRKSLWRYCKQAKESEQGASALNFGYTKPRQVFTEEEEDEIAKYIKESCDIYFGLCTKEVRKLASDYARVRKKKVPEQWTKAEIAGEDWFSSFMDRHKELSIRQPEATCLARAEGFNRTAVTKKRLFPKNKSADKKKTTKQPVKPCKSKRKRRAVKHISSDESSDLDFDDFQPIAHCSKNLQPFARRSKSLCADSDSDIEPSHKQFKIKLVEKLKKKKDAEKAVQKETEKKDEDVPCLVCCESYSRSKEIWLQCINCLRWAHEQYTDGNPS